MNKRFIVAGLIALALILAVPIFTYAFGSGAFGYGMMGPGMMNSFGSPARGISGGPGQGMQGGFMNGISGAPMGGMMGTSMMGNGFGGTSYGIGTQPEYTVDTEKARELVNQFIASSNMKGISLAEIMEFESHFYVELKEDGGKYTHELIVDKVTGSIYPEMGPNMMWNSKYGHMGGMMSGFSAQAGDSPAVSPEQSVEIANRYLAQAGTGETAAEPHEFYGYYTLHTIKDGNIFGMLSVNSYNGQVWYHSWHGKYVSSSLQGHGDGH
ncbi:MAG: hypothetical protein ACOY30_07460 [Bacillota bacterium]